jgi:hypothetical protein
MQTLFPKLTVSTLSQPAINKSTALPRHPARYRITFTLIGLPVQNLLLDEIPTLANIPPKQDEDSSSLALQHSLTCTSTSARLITPCYLSTLNCTRYITKMMIKVCYDCITTLPKVSLTSPHESYAVITTSHLLAWNHVEARSSLDYYTLPPPRCQRPHNPLCRHTHCTTPEHCTCTQPSQSDPTCSHPHCDAKTDAECTCKTENTCTNPADHIPSADGKSHPNCNAPHCDDHAAHGFTPSQREKCPFPHCRNPSDHLAATSPITPDHFNVTMWYEYRASQFENSPPGRTFSLDTKKLLKYFKDHYPRDQSQTPLPTFPIPFSSPLDHPDDIINEVIQATHERSIFNDRSLHAEHECLILSCPIKVIGRAQKGSATATGLSLSQVLLLGRQNAADIFSSRTTKSPSSSDVEDSDDGLDDSD